MNDNDWRIGIDQRLRGVEGRLQEIEKNNAVAEAHHNNVEKRLGDIEGTLTWLVRLIIGALVLAALGFAMNGGFA